MGASMRRNLGFSHNHQYLQALQTVRGESPQTGEDNIER